MNSIVALPIRLESERGIALLSVLMLLMIMTAATLSLSVGTQTQLALSRNLELGAQSQVAAEAGLNHAVDVTLAFMGQWQAGGFANPSAAMTSLLLGPDGNPGTADDGSLDSDRRCAQREQPGRHDQY